MNELQSSLLGEIPRRIFQINSAGSPIAVMSPFLDPAMVLESDRPEYRWLSRQRYAGRATGTLPAVAAQYSTAQLQNPAGSNTLLIVERMRVTTAAGGGAFIIPSQAAYPLTALPATVRDTRWQTGVAASLLAQPVGKVVGGAYAAVPAEAAADLIPAGTTITTDAPYVISPGMVLTLRTTAVNLTLAVAFLWYERPVTAYELP